MQYNRYSAPAVLIVSSLIFAPARATITVPGANGSDGPLNITADTVIDLSQAPTGVWNTNSPTPGKGVYDPTQWAVVFHYSSVSVATGATVTFTNHASRAPVIWLVSGNVNIAGTISLNGSDSNQNNFPPPAEPGPGGFRGALGNSVSTTAGSGFGPGGGPPTKSGSYATQGANGVPGLIYGSPTLVPLIGGSGGGTYVPSTSWNSGAGGGAILIAATGTITVNGALTANAGQYPGANTDGSGGAIRLVADRITGLGTGRLSAIDTHPSHSGGDGRIRIEANQAPADFSSIVPNPSAAATGATAVVFPDASAPSARIVSVGSTAAPADPRGNLGSTADVPLDIVESANPVKVTIETKNVPVPPNAPTINLRVGPVNAPATMVAATFVSGTTASALWQATYQPVAGTSTLLVRVEAP